MIRDRRMKENWTIFYVYYDLLKTCWDLFQRCCSMYGCLWLRYYAEFWGFMFWFYTKYWNCYIYLGLEHHVNWSQICSMIRCNQDMWFIHYIIFLILGLLSPLTFFLDSMLPTLDMSMTIQNILTSESFMMSSIKKLLWVSLREKIVRSPNIS